MLNIEVIHFSWKYYSMMRKRWTHGHLIREYYLTVSNILCCLFFIAYLDVRNIIILPQPYRISINYKTAQISCFEAQIIWLLLCYNRSHLLVGSTAHLNTPKVLTTYHRIRENSLLHTKLFQRHVTSTQRALQRHFPLASYFQLLRFLISMTLSRLAWNKVMMTVLKALLWIQNELQRHGQNLEVRLK